MVECHTGSVEVVSSSLIVSTKTCGIRWVFVGFSITEPSISGGVAQLVRVPASHAGGPGFEPRRVHQIRTLIRIQFVSLSAFLFVTGMLCKPLIQRYCRALSCNHAFSAPPRKGNDSAQGYQRNVFRAGRVTAAAIVRLSCRNGHLSRYHEKSAMNAGILLLRSLRIFMFIRFSM